MRLYSETVQADVSRRMSPPGRQSVTQMFKELGIHMATQYAWRKTWRLQGEVVPAPERAQKPGALPASSQWCWRAQVSSRRPAKQYATELSAFCRKRGLYPEQGQG
jgi:hypothetical protein